MPQIQLPIFPQGVTYITALLAFSKQDGRVTYFNGSMPIFVHEEEDVDSFRMITAQFCVNGNAKQADIVRAFGVTKISLKRAVKRYREEGPKGFYKPRQRRGPAVLTAVVLEQAQQLLDEGLDIPEVADRLGIKRDTLRKAVRAGRLHKAVKKNPGELTSKSERSRADRLAPMGVAAADVAGRLAASVGELDAVAPDFTPALDVPNGGLLCALPALIAVGLLEGVERYLQLPKGYYGLDSLLLLLAFMALARLESIESLRYSAPGEWGNLLGLDRVPEVRTLRAKIQLLAQEDAPQQWSAALCERWMAAAPEHSGVLYIDGHVRVYNGSQTQLPRHYIARQRLCLRATTDYWVNAMDGQPFFVVNQAVDPGLIQVIEQAIVPRLEQRLPTQVDVAQLPADPLRHRFTLVFDREGYSPDFLRRMKAQRIACLTYHKYPGEDWPQAEFVPAQVQLPSGERVSMNLAERGTRLSNGLWVRELRKLTDRGHQTAILCTNYRAEAAPLAMAMFARWSQENFFKYAREHFALDRLVDYRTESISEPLRVVNPDYRHLDGQVRSATGKLTRRLAKFAAMTLEEPIEPKHVEPFVRRKAALQEQIETLQHELDALKTKRKETPHHVTLDALPEEARFRQLSTQSKQLVDTIKMIAYRAETAMANSLREHLKRPDEARRLLRALYTTEADLLPDPEAGTLTVRLHHGANAATDQVIEKLCAELNATETVFPRTNLRLVLKLGST
jgi:transposase